MNPRNAGLWTAGGLAVVALSRLGNNPLLHHSNMKAFYGWAIAAALVCLASFMIGPKQSPGRSR